MPEDTATDKVPNTLAILFRSELGWAVAALLGVAGIFAARVFGFPNPPAVQATIGAFGLAAIASDAVGEGLQTFLLPLIAWALAFGLWR